MSNVTRLPGAHTPESEPVEDVVVKLEEMLRRAKNGEIRAMGVVGVMKDGTCITTWANENHTFTLIGALQYLVHRITTRVDQP